MSIAGVRRLEAVAGMLSRPGYWAPGRRDRSALARLASDRAAVAGIALVVGMIVAALGAPLLAPHDPTAVDLARRLSEPASGHPLGTDHLGRCVLSRLLYGGRISLSVAIAITFAGVCAGAVAGVLSGYYGGLLDEALMRLVDVLLALPGLVLALAIAGTLGPGLISIAIGVGIVLSAQYARLIRGIVLAVRQEEFVEAARSLGVGDRGIMVRHILPQVLGPVAVLATLELGRVMLIVAGLSFLGLGAQPPSPEWGAMLNEGRPFMRAAPLLMLGPGAAIGLAVLGSNLFGDGLRDALDPRPGAARWV